MSQTVSKGDVLQRIAGVSFILGAILTLVGNVLAPRPDDPTSVAQSIAKLAEHPTMAKVAFFTITVGIWMLVAGFAGVYRSIVSGGASAWARLGFYGVVASSAIFTVALAVFNGATMAAQKGAPGAALAAPLVVAGNSLFTMAMITWWLALAISGLGILMSSVYPKWAGWVLFVPSAAIVVVSGLPAVLNTPTMQQDIIFGVLAGLTSLWALWIGLWITRREMKAMKAR